MKFLKGFEKTAFNKKADDVNMANAAAIQRGALSGATSASQAWKNIKSGLGFGAPQGAPANVGKM